MTKKHTTQTPTLLDPMLINIRHQLRLYLNGITPLIANQTGLSIMQAQVLCHHTSDAVLIFLLKSYQNNNLQSQPNQKKFNNRTHYVLHETSIDTTTLTRLPKIALDTLFGEQTAKVMHRLANLGNLYVINPETNTPSEQFDINRTTAISECIATIALHHIDILAYNAKLDFNERCKWFELQPLFLKDKVNVLVWASLADYHLDPPQNSTYSDYRKKLGKVDVMFDSSQYNLPNHAWLLNLAKTIQEKHQEPLSIGKVISLELIAINNDQPIVNQPKKKISPLLIAGIVVLALLALFIIVHLTSSKQVVITPTDTKAVQTKTQALGHQDIAVIRIDDDKPNISIKTLETDKPTNNEDKKDRQDNTNQDQSSKQASDKPTSSKKTQDKNTPNHKKETEKPKTDKSKKDESKPAITQKDIETPKKDNAQNQKITKHNDDKQNNTESKDRQIDKQNKKPNKTDVQSNKPADKPSWIDDAVNSPPAAQVQASKQQTTSDKNNQSIVLRYSKNNPSSYHQATSEINQNPKNHPNTPSDSTPAQTSKNKPDE